MSTTHHHDQHATIPVRCLRHRVWMAACTDCREAHRASAARRVTASSERATG